MTRDPDLPDLPAAPAARPARFPVAAMLALAAGGFAIGTGEFVIMGLLPEVAASLNVSIAQAGHAISAYALGVTIGAPVLAVLTARWERRFLLVAMMLTLALGNLASAAAASHGWLLGLRFFAGLPHGAYFGAASLVAAALAPPGRRASAVALVMTGLTTSTVLGVPLAARAGEWLGWRAAFVCVGLAALAAAAMIVRWVPRQAATAQGSPLSELAALRVPQVWLTLGIGAIGFGGMFAVFSYIKPILLHVAHMPAQWVAPTLSVVGLGMVAGNLAGARLADRWLMPSIAGILLWALASMAFFHWGSQWPLSAALAAFCVGTTGALGVGTQIRLMDVAGRAQSLAAALNHSAFNIANALGAWLGGLAIDAGWGWRSTSWVGAALALGGLLIFALSATLAWREGQRRPAA